MHQVYEKKIRSALDSFAERLRDQREARGLSRQAVADEIGMNMITIKLIEDREVTPSFSTVLKLSVALGISLDRFKRLAS